MNFHLPNIPERLSKPRETGITMVMDKGAPLQQVENFLDAHSDHIDIVKLGFGTSYLTKNLEGKLKMLREANVKAYFGGTLFEAFVIRGMFDDYLKLLDKYKMEVAEVSDGSIVIPHDEKCEYISKLAKEHTVLSEVGSKEEGLIIHPAKWTSMMNKELEAGSWKVIAEAREGGNRNGSTHTVLINKIIARVPKEKIIWETPQKSQQVWFIKLFGANVNLGNIGYDDVIPLETLRIGLRGDTFFTFLPKNISNKTKT